jgi:ferredoxin-type protein NapH
MGLALRKWMRAIFLVVDVLAAAMTDLQSGMVLVAVIALFAVPALLVGRRAGCHTVCWIAPFMMGGRWVSRRFSLPALRMKAESPSCTKCGTCNAACPMSIAVKDMVPAGTIDNGDCILCGSCADACPRGVISYSVRP